MRKQIVKTMLAVSLSLSPLAVLSMNAQPVQAAEQNTASLHAVWTADLPGQYASDITVGENGLSYLVVNKHTSDGSEYPQLVCIDTKNNGAVKWQQELTGMAQGAAPAVAKDGSVYVATQGFDPDGTTFFAFDANGKLKWKKDALQGGMSVSVAPNGDVYLLGHSYANSTDSIQVFKSTGELIYQHDDLGSDNDRFTYPENVSFDSKGTPYLLYKTGNDTASNSVVTLDFDNQTLREVFKPQDKEVALQQLFVASDGSLNAVGWQYLGYDSPTDSFLYAVNANGQAKTAHLGTQYAVLHKGADGSLLLTTSHQDENADGLTDGFRAYDPSTLTPKWESNAFQSQHMMTSNGDTLQDGTFVLPYTELDTDTVESGVLGFDRSGKQLFKVPAVNSFAVVAGNLVLELQDEQVIAYTLGAGSPTTPAQGTGETAHGYIDDLLQALKQEQNKDAAIKRASDLRSSIERDATLSTDDLATYLAEVADSFHQLGRLDEAILTLEEAASYAPESRSLYAALGARYAEAGNPDIHVLVNGSKPDFDVLPIEQNSRTLVPLRAIGEALGAEIGWDEATSTVTMTRDGHTVKLTLGKKTAAKDGQAVQLDVPAQSINNRTVVPLRFISEAFGAKVTWFEDGKVAAITDSDLK